MPNSTGVSDNEKFSSRKSGSKAMERSNFAHTCSLLSQYLKEKGSFADLSLGMNGKLEAKEKSETFRASATSTMNLLPPNMEKSNVKSIDFLPLFTSFGSSSFKEDAISTKTEYYRKTATKEPETSQMTIFYGGQVLVFDDFPAEKAREIMLLASKESSHNSSGFLSTSSIEKINSSSFVAPGSNIVSTPGSNATQEHVQVQPQAAAGSDLRIARRASLNRFFEKRKDRATARAPYQVNNPYTPPKPEESRRSGLDLEAQSSKLELKL